MATALHDPDVREAPRVTRGLEPPRWRGRMRWRVHWRWRDLAAVAADSSFRLAVSWWLASKVAIVALAWVTSWITQPFSRTQLTWWRLWESWDASVFRLIAQHGYLGPPGKTAASQVAFLPGFPLALRVVHVVIPRWTAAEMALGGIASFFAIWGLVRPAADYQAASAAWAGAFLRAAPAAAVRSVGD